MTIILDTLRERRREWQWLLWHDIGAARFDEPDAVGVWSVKDVIAHVGVYERYALDQLRAHLAGTAEAPSTSEAGFADFAQRHGYPDFGSELVDDDTANATIYRAYADKPLDEIVDEEQRIFDALVETLHAFGNDRLLSERSHGRSLLRMLEDNTWGHYEQHVDDLRDWLATPAIYGLDHVQLAIPAGGETAARAFYIDVLGLREIPKPEALAGRGGLWMQRGALTLHLGADSDFRAAQKAHPALLCGDLDALVAVCRAAHIETKEDTPLAGYKRMHVFDPFGNRIELMQKLQTQR
jgi:catechol 2,3-dioxygenase-like lactoylglutathione lyase family enzyme